jgi:hypothetical protein
MAKQTFSIPCRFRRTTGKWDDPNRQEFVTLADVLIEIDLGAIAEELGYRAIRSKGGKARALRGLIVVKCKNARRLDPPPVWNSKGTPPA